VDDPTLLDIVKLIRSDPPTGEPDKTRLNGQLPISFVRSRNTGIQVTLSTGAGSGQTVTMERHRGNWVITSLSRWIV
jgi:hypothetical protein